MWKELFNKKSNKNNNKIITSSKNIIIAMEKERTALIHKSKRRYIRANRRQNSIRSIYHFYGGEWGKNTLQKLLAVFTGCDPVLRGDIGLSGDLDAEALSADDLKVASNQNKKSKIPNKN